MTVHAIDGFTPTLHPEAFVHPDTTLIGHVTVGARSSVWPGVVLRGDMRSRIVIGDESSIQDGTVAHLTEDLSETVVGHRCTVGHRVILHGCIVEDECLIGMGAILLDNARIGTGSLVGAGALVTGGTIVPPGSLVVGSPAKVLRPVGDKERKLIDKGWRNYVDLSRRYMAELAARR
ncbi:MAG: gamma carbonic anhydrase family protein [Deltaproteobacteria bacterium]|nr:gamma carbonic anhydrase family protein [Deltaproteobacteria bacterium]